MLKNLNWLASSVLIAYPILLIALVSLYIMNNGVGWFEVGLFLSAYYISNITVGIGLHRLWSHDTYKINKYVEFILAVLAAGTLQGPALSWASNHFRHHTYTDTDQDPHSPLKYKSKVQGFFWSHMGWMLTGEGSYKSIDRITMTKLGRNKILKWQLKYYWQIALAVNIFVPLLIGYLFGSTLLAAYAGFLFMGLGRAVQQQITFFVNSTCHFIGTKQYAKGTAGDIWWLFFCLLGENWHNFHHAFPSDYRNGVKWYHADVHKWIIYLMSVCGLAWDLKRTAPVRVEAKVSQTMEQFVKARKEQIELMQGKVSNLAKSLQEKLAEIENSSNNFKVKKQRSLANLQNNLINLTHQLKNIDSPSEQIIKNIAKQVMKAEESIRKFYSEIENPKSFA